MKEVAEIKCTIEFDADSNAVNQAPQNLPETGSLDIQVQKALISAMSGSGWAPCARYVLCSLL